MDNALARFRRSPWPRGSRPLPTARWPASPPCPAARKLMALLGVAALVAVLAAMAMWSREGDYKVLYANLSDKDGGAIIAQLSQMNVPYRHADGGSAILVPADKVHDAAPEARLGRPAQGQRRRLRADGQRPLRPDPVPGTPDLPARPRRRAGALDPRARLRCRRRACTWRCRNQNGFFREQQKPSASVLLHAAPGPHARPRAGRRHRAPGVVVSVPELNPKAVSVLDQTGALLSGAATTPRAARAWTRSSCSTCSRSSRATSSA